MASVYDTAYDPTTIEKVWAGVKTIAIQVIFDEIHDGYSLRKLQRACTSSAHKSKQEIPEEVLSGIIFYFLIVSFHVVMDVIMQVVDIKKFRQNPETEMRATHNEPVVVIDQGQISHVLLSCEDYNALHMSQNLTERLACSESADFEFEFQKLSQLTQTEEF